MRKSSLVLGCILSGFFCIGQHTISAGGGDAISITGTSNFTIGQTVYSNHITSNGEVLEGVQIPYEIAVLVNTDKEEDRFLLSVFPNPTSDVLYLTSSILDKEFSYDLYTESGVLITSASLLKTTSIELHNQSSGVYLLSVKDQENILKTFKIIKK